MGNFNESYSLVFYEQKQDLMDKKTIVKFKDFLTARGAEILTPTNEYEVLRFRSLAGVSVVYTGRRGITMTAESEKAFQAFQNNSPWSAGVFTHGRMDPNRRSVKVRTLFARDGDRCFYCLNPMECGKETIEHLLPIAHGGNHHLSNLVLAHGQCNLNGGHLSVMEKIKRREASFKNKENINGTQ